MSSSPINGINWQDPNQTQDPTKTSEHKKTSDHDTVKLSIGAQVLQLRQEGFSTQEIAFQLGLTTSEVLGYLSISDFSQSASMQTSSTNKY